MNNIVTFCSLYYTHSTVSLLVSTSYNPFLLQRNFIYPSTWLTLQLFLVGCWISKEANSPWEANCLCTRNDEMVLLQCHMERFKISMDIIFFPGFILSILEKKKKHWNLCIFRMNINLIGILHQNSKMRS